MVSLSWFNFLRLDWATPNKVKDSSKGDEEDVDEGLFLLPAGPD